MNTTEEIINAIRAAEAAVVEAERIHGWKSIEAADARSAYQAAWNKARA